MDRGKFYQRIIGVVDPARLAQKRVAVVGVGSGGGRVAVELGRLGVRLLLIDRPGELLEEHNIVRHFLGYSSLGKPKLQELRRAILNLNPSSEISLEEVDAVESREKLASVLTCWQPDVLAVCTDNEQSKHALNQVALNLETPQVGAGVYDGGIGGEVYCVRPGFACYGCIADHLHLERYTSPEQIRPDYNHLDTRAPASACALNLDIEQVASLQSRMILDLLLGPDAGFIGLSPEINLCVFANRVVPETFARPLHAEFFQIAKRRECLDCGQADADVQRQAKKILAALRVPAAVSSCDDPTA